VTAIDLSHDAFSHGALSSTVATLTFLASVGVATPRAIQAATGFKRAGTIYKHLGLLVEAGYAEREGDGTWSFTTPSSETLDQVARSMGTAGRGARLRERNVEQRGRWPQALDVLRKHREQARVSARAQATRPTVVPDEITGQLVPTMTLTEAVRRKIMRPSDPSFPYNAPFIDNGPMFSYTVRRLRPLAPTTASGVELQVAV
jgi:hypothetical protein